MLHHIYNATIAVINKLEKGLSLTEREEKDLENLSSILMICYLNGFDDAKQKLIDAKLFLKGQKNPTVYISFKEAMRILRKIKYGSEVK
jgi:hypothetical protein